MEEKIFAVYKPKGPTSHDIIDFIRRLTRIKKVGHAGTLDPLAKGVLVIAVTREGTKQLTDLIKNEKEYIADIKLGETSNTDDDEGEKTATEGAEPVSREDIEEVLPQFQGDIMQTPPIYSALKIKGQNAYKLARKGKKIEMEARPVVIKEIEILEYEWPMLKIRTVTGSGVYIRSLARDIGQALGVGGYLAGLERTRVGAFTKEDALTLDDLEAKFPKP